MPKKKDNPDRGTGASHKWRGPDALRPLLVPIDSLHPDPANARRHPERNTQAIVGSLDRFGQRFPIVVQKQGMVVRAGNGRIEAMKSMGWDHVAAVIVDESSVDATAFAIADNRTAELAEWDDETLASLLQSMDEPDRESAGFNEAELGELLERLTPTISEPDNLGTVGDVEYRVVVSVSNDRQQAELMERLEAEGYRCQPLMS